MAITKSRKPTPSQRTQAKQPAEPVMLDLSQLDFIGCEAIPMTLEQYHRFEGRLEVWDAELQNRLDGARWPRPRPRKPRSTLGWIG